MAIPKIRAGNDFVYVWAIERNGVAVDLTAATIVRLSYGVGKPCNSYTEIPFEIIDGNKVRSSHNYENTGTYNLRLEFTMAGVDSTVDIDAFVIVPRSALASEATDFAVTSDMAIGFKGDSAYQIWLDAGNTGTVDDYLADIKGDPLTYDDLTPEQIVELQQPATDAILSIQAVELAVETAEGLRVQAELNRQSDTATAISNAEQATDDANDAAILANEKAGLANDAALLANEKAGLAATATTQANAARDGANTAATNADNARLAIQTDLAKKQEVVVNYTHTGNKEVNIESIDFATGTITATGHGLAVNSVVYLINKGMGNFPFSALPNGLNPFTVYYVINVTTNTFQLSITYGGVPTPLSDKATKDYSKWHFEIPGNATISGLSLRKFTVEIEGKSSGNQAINDYFYLTGSKSYGAAGAVWITDTERAKITAGLSVSVFRSMANGDIWAYNRLNVDVTGKRASILINGYRIYSLTETTSGIIRHNNEVAVHSSVGEDVVTSLTQIGIFNGMNIKVTKIL